MFAELNIHGHMGCEDYSPESYTKFVLTDLKNKETIAIDNNEYNHIIVILKGKVLIEYNEFLGKTFSGGEIVFMPSYSDSHIEAVEESKILCGTFEFPHDVYMSKMLEDLSHLKSDIKYTFSSLPIKPIMQDYLNLLIAYLKDGIQCSMLHEIKEKEIFMVFRWYYSDEEFVSLFHPIIGKSLDFRSLVVKYYNKVKSIEELARMLNMSRSNFDAKFKEVFEESPKQWILKRKAKSIKYFMSKPGVTISDIMIKFGFDSFTHFNRFCKQQFGATPSELIKSKK